MSRKPVKSKPAARHRNPPPRQHRLINAQDCPPQLRLTSKPAAPNKPLSSKRPRLSAAMTEKRLSDAMTLKRIAWRQHLCPIPHSPPNPPSCSTPSCGGHALRQRRTTLADHVPTSQQTNPRPTLLQIANRRRQCCRPQPNPRGSAAYSILRLSTAASHWRGGTSYLCHLTGRALSEVRAGSRSTFLRHFHALTGNSCRSTCHTWRETA